MKRFGLAIVVLILLAAAMPLGMGVPTVSADEGTRWAILVCGGMDAQQNYAYFWNSLSETYQVLVNNYGYDPASVFVLYADGGRRTRQNCYSAGTISGLTATHPYANYPSERNRRQRYLRQAAECVPIHRRPRRSCGHPFTFTSRTMVDR